MVRAVGTSLNEYKIPKTIKIYLGLTVYFLVVITLSQGDFGMMDKGDRVG